MNHYQFVFEPSSSQQKDLLIALLDNAGFEGFEEENDQLKAFVSQDAFNENLFNNIIENNSLRYSKSIIQEINWNEQWEHGFEPVIVQYIGSEQYFAAVRASFHQPVENVKYDLLVTPKMSFGTGHHATTYQMIQQMSEVDFAGKIVIDFGTGTGVLAILAEKMGAGNVTAIDNDDWSINNAKENIEANNCNRIELLKAETIDVGQKADIILANINLNIIIANLDAVKLAAKPGATIIFSGIMGQDKQQILTALEDAGFIIKDCLTKDNWLVIHTFIP